MCSSKDSTVLLGLGSSVRYREARVLAPFGVTFAHLRVSSRASSEKLFCYNKERLDYKVLPLAAVVPKGGSSFHKGKVG